MAALTHMPGVLVGLLFVLLCYNFVQWLHLCWLAISYPGQLGFVEGVIWQQAQMIANGEGYAPIAESPYIVFHYPPVFHLLVIGVADIFNISYLTAGRMISAAAAIGLAAMAAVLSVDICRIKSCGRYANATALLVFLAFFTLFPFSNWAIMMTADVLALALSLAGILIVVRASESRCAVIFSALVCVAAAYSKQTTIFLSGSVFLFLLILNWRQAFLWAAVAITAGLLVLALLQIQTDGEFWRHNFLYNINRFEFKRLLISIDLIAAYPLFAAIICIAIKRALGLLWPETKKSISLHNLRRAIQNSEEKRLYTFWVIFIILAALQTIAYAKNGSDFNYFIPLCLASVLGLGLLAPQFFKDLFEKAEVTQITDSTRHRLLYGRMGGLVILTFAVVQFFWMPGMKNLDHLYTQEAVQQREEMKCHVARAQKPIISDNMVVLLTNEKSVLWESAIFAELAAKGLWDPSDMINRFRAQEFEFIITDGSDGDSNFEGRFSPLYTEALDEQYPIEKNLVGFVMHLPEAYRAEVCSSKQAPSYTVP